MAFGEALNPSTYREAAVGSKDERWGYLIRPEESRLRCMKLLLDGRQELPSYVSINELRDQLEATGKSVHIVVADYLRLLFKHAKEILSRRYGEYFIAHTKIIVVLTVPAVWSDAAKDATLRAAEAAGMGENLALISEPEAAAVYALQAIQPNHLTTGHNFVVVDAGGGTVDLISYEIKQVSPLRIEESAPGSGACCGGAMLNVRFIEWMRAKLGEDLFVSIRDRKPKSWQMATKHFEEYVKRNFDPDEDTEFNIPLAGVADNEAVGIEQGFLTITSKEVASIFKPIITEIIQLVQGQMTHLHTSGKSVNGIILVGGFGQSECLLKIMRMRFASGNNAALPPNSRLEVMQPTNAWTAVVRGAVIRGLEGTEMVLNRKARRHYGVRVNARFDDNLHPLSCKYWDIYDESWRAKDRMSWFIRKGQAVSATEPAIFAFYRDIPTGGSKIVHDELIACDLDQAPTGFEHGLRTSTHVLCRLTSDLSKVPITYFKNQVTVDGKRFQRISYKLGMRVESGGLRFDLRVGNVEYGSVKATFE